MTPYDATWHLELVEQLGGRLMLLELVERTHDARPFVRRSLRRSDGVDRRDDDRSFGCAARTYVSSSLPTPTRHLLGHDEVDPRRLWRRLGIIRQKTPYTTMPHGTLWTCGHTLDTMKSISVASSSPRYLSS